LSKNIIAVLIAPIVWGLVGVPGNLVIMSMNPEVSTGTVTETYLFSALIASFFYSAIAGGVAAWVAQPNFERIGLYAGVAVLAVGIAVQAANWNALPQWYHLAFLFWLIPLCMVGANIVRARRTAKPK
jgi:hypothetical protein